MTSPHTPSGLGRSVPVFDYSNLFDIDNVINDCLNKNLNRPEGAPDHINIKYEKNELYLLLFGISTNS